MHGLTWAEAQGPTEFRGLSMSWQSRIVLLLVRFSVNHFIRTFVAAD